MTNFPDINQSEWGYTSDLVFYTLSFYLFDLTWFSIIYSPRCRTYGTWWWLAGHSFSSACLSVDDGRALLSLSTCRWSWPHASLSSTITKRDDDARNEEKLVGCHRFPINDLQRPPVLGFLLSSRPFFDKITTEKGEEESKSLAYKKWVGKKKKRPRNRRVSEHVTYMLNTRQTWIAGENSGRNSRSNSSREIYDQEKTNSLQPGAIKKSKTRPFVKLENGERVKLNSVASRFENFSLLLLFLRQTYLSLPCHFLILSLSTCLKDLSLSFSYWASGPTPAGMRSALGREWPVNGKRLLCLLRLRYAHRQTDSLVYRDTLSSVGGVRLRVYWSCVGEGARWPRGSRIPVALVFGGLLRHTTWDRKRWRKEYISTTDRKGNFWFTWLFLYFYLIFSPRSFSTRHSSHLLDVVFVGT